MIRPNSIPLTTEQALGKAMLQQITDMPPTSPRELFMVAFLWTRAGG